jgi:hypothetical protein
MTMVVLYKWLGQIFGNVRACTFNFNIRLRLVSNFYIFVIITAIEHASFVFVSSEDKDTVFSYTGPGNSEKLSLDW